MKERERERKTQKRYKDNGERIRRGGKRKSSREVVCGDGKQHAGVRNSTHVGMRNGMQGWKTTCREISWRDGKQYMRV